MKHSSILLCYSVWDVLSRFGHGGDTGPVKGCYDAFSLTRQFWQKFYAIYVVNITGQFDRYGASCFLQILVFKSRKPALTSALLANHVEPDAPEKGRVLSRWGKCAEAGYQPVPDVLLFHQKELGLRSEDLNVLLHISAHWFYPEKMPFPRPANIAKRMDVSERTVQRSLTRLRKMGLLGKSKNADGRPAFDLRPLVARLEPLAKKRLFDKEAARAIAGEVSA